MVAEALFALANVCSRMERPSEQLSSRPKGYGRPHKHLDEGSHGAQLPNSYHIPKGPKGLSGLFSSMWLPILFLMHQRSKH
jgi:hypothetical protein